MIHRLRYGHWPRWFYYSSYSIASRLCERCGRKETIV